MPKIALILGAWFVGQAGLAQMDTPVSSSASYILQQSTVNGGGSTSVSPTGQNYRLTASAGQEASIGTSSAPHYVLQSGFWSFLGSGLVPVILTANKGGINPSNVDLTWTGNNSPYAIYRHTDPATVYANFLVTEPTKAYTDAPPVVTIWYYSVLATAPGPKAPPPGPVPIQGEPGRPRLEVEPRLGARPVEWR